MPGIEIIETGANAATAIGAWNNLSQTIKSYTSGNATQDNVQQAAATFVAAASALNSSGLAKVFSGIAGFATSAANWQSDLDAYNKASDIGNTPGKNEAFASLIGDAAGLGQAVSAGLTAVATQAGEAGLAAVVGTMGTEATVIGGVAGVAGVGLSAANWFQNYLNELGNALNQGAIDWNNMMLDIGASNQNGQSLIVVAGQPGDSLIETPLSGGGFSYSELNSSGVQTSSATLTANGSANVELISGQGVVSDVNGFQIYLGNGASATVVGSGNTVIAGSNDILNVTGSSNMTSVTGTGTTVTDSGSRDTTTLAGTNDVATVSGLGSTGTGTDTTDTINAVGTNGSVQASGEGGMASVSATGASSARQGFSQAQLAGLIPSGIATLASSQAQYDASTNQAIAVLQLVDPVGAAEMAAQKQQSDAMTAQDIQMLSAMQSLTPGGNASSAAALLASLSPTAATSSQGLTSSSLAALQAAMSSSLPLSASTALAASTSSAGASSTSANSAVAQMIQAMAAYGASAGATTTITPPAQTLTALLAASATH
ncbi:hypothetical protein AAB992_39020 [Burkholderia contaminans]|uniref:hypothetical protein n=1 Tax=Burkholderia contaminans TaxID=488447 RepID=UPI0024159D03|nr:hypothetical protein [Burkholderia contaminans]WFN14445.1 hypothetical protein LXE92_36675 [Burkholderia contaminans]